MGSISAIGNDFQIVQKFFEKSLKLSLSYSVNFFLN
jgi:hypothetical protein